jgi:hypothetical protein
MNFVIISIDLPHENVFSHSTANFRMLMFCDVHAWSWQIELDGETSGRT